MVKTGILVTAVAAILVLGWARQTTEAPTTAREVQSTRAQVPSELPRERPSPRLQGDVVPPPSDSARAADPFAEQAARDSEKLARSGGQWTLQLLVACRPETITRLREKAGASDRLFLLPVKLEGRACYRACWGVYASHDEAAAARDLPAALRPGAESARPRAVEEVVP